MENPVYAYQSTLYNFTPFVVNYEFLEEVLGDIKEATEKFNSSFSKNLKKLVSNSTRVQVPTLKNLYEQVLLSLKSNLTKTLSIQSSLTKTYSQLSTNLSKLNLTHQSHLLQLSTRCSQSTLIKKHIQFTHTKLDKLNQQIQLIIESDTVDKLYKLNYKDNYQGGGHYKLKSELQAQLEVMNAKMEYYEENLEQEVMRSKRLCGILGNQLEEIMINTTFVDLGVGMGKTGGTERTRRSNSPLMVSEAVEEECIRVEQGRGEFTQQVTLQMKIGKMKEEIDNYFDQLDYEQ